VDFELRVTRSRKPGALLTGGRMTWNEGMRDLVRVGGEGIRSVSRLVIIPCRSP